MSSDIDSTKVYGEADENPYFFNKSENELTQIELLCKELIVEKNKFKKQLEETKTMEQIRKDFKKKLENDEGTLLAWHSNIAMWLYDNANIFDYEPRNHLACKFMKYFHNIEYDWRKLLGYAGGENNEKQK